MTPEVAARLVAIMERLDEIGEETTNLTWERRELMQAEIYNGTRRHELAKAVGLNPSRISQILKPTNRRP